MFRRELVHSFVNFFNKTKVEIFWQSQRDECGIETLRPEHDPRQLGPARRGAVCARRVYAYRRTGDPCLVCGTPIAHEVHLARNLFWCPTCQPAVSA